MRYHPLGNGRFFMRMDPDDEIIAALRQLLSQEGITAGLVRGVGWASSVTLGFLMPDGSDYARRRFDEPVCISSLTGTISVEAEDGRPYVHLQAVLAPQEHIAYAGVLVEGRVGAVLEAVITAFDPKLERVDVADEAYPRAFPWLFLPDEPRPTPSGGSPENGNGGSGGATAGGGAAD